MHDVYVDEEKEKKTWFMKNRKGEKMKKSYRRELRKI
jgi:hypothetical protein